MKLKNLALLSLLLLGAAMLWIPGGPALPPGLTLAQINNPQSGAATSLTSAAYPLLGPADNCTTAPNYSWTGDTNTGICHPAASAIGFAAGGTEQMRVSNSGALDLGGNKITFGSAINSDDLGISRSSAGVFAIGNSGAGDTTGRVKAAGYMSVGTKFTTNAGCGESAGTIVGGATAGKITTAGSTSCTTIITFGNGASAPNGWDCSVTDLTTAADAHNPRLSASNATTATIITGTIVASDVLSVSCIGY